MLGQVFLRLEQERVSRCDKRMQYLLPTSMRLNIQGSNLEYSSIEIMFSGLYEVKV